MYSTAKPPAQQERIEAPTRANVDAYLQQRHAEHAEFDDDCAAYDRLMADTEAEHQQRLKDEAPAVVTTTRRRDAHAHSLRSYLSAHRKALASFYRTGDLAQQDWADKYLQAARLHAAIVVEVGGEVPAEPELQPEAPDTVEAASGEVEQPKVRPRCSHYHLIREMFAVAREQGLDVSDAARDRMRGAIGMLLGRRIESRSQLAASDWAFCTNAVRLGRLFW